MQQRDADRRGGGHGRFNPHRPRKAGATWWWRRRRWATAGFNPHRPRKAGATARRAGAPLGASWFQSSPASKGRCNGWRAWYCAGVGAFQSSPASKGRCNGVFHREWGSRRCFNPHRPRKAGATRSPPSLCPGQPSFNPHRPRKAGATRMVGSEALHAVVSILTGLERPVQRLWPVGSGAGAKFQSSPASKGRCNTTTGQHYRRRCISFNPHRPRKAGATPGGSLIRGQGLGFNPHRPRKAGATDPGKPPQRAFPSSNQGFWTPYPYSSSHRRFLQPMPARVRQKPQNRARTSFVKHPHSRSAQRLMGPEMRKDIPPRRSSAHQDPRNGPRRRSPRSVHVRQAGDRCGCYPSQDQ